MNWKAYLCLGILLGVVSLGVNAQSDPQQSVEVDSLSVSGELGSNPLKSDFIIKGTFKPNNENEKEPLVFDAVLDGKVGIATKSIREDWQLKLVRVRGDWDRLQFVVITHRPDARISIIPDVGDDFHYSVQATGKLNERLVTLTARKQASSVADYPVINVKISSVVELTAPPTNYRPILVKIDEAVAVSGNFSATTEGPLNLRVNRQGHASTITHSDNEPRSKKVDVTILGADYQTSLIIQPDQPDQFKNSFRDFKLSADFNENDRLVSMHLRGVADFRHLSGGEMALLGGDIGLVSYTLLHPEAKLRFQNGYYYLQVDKPASVEVDIRFHCKIDDQIGEKAINVFVVNSTIRPIDLRGWTTESSFKISPLGDIEVSDDHAKGFLKPGGAFNLAWKSEAPVESEKVFFSVQGTGQVSLGSGRISQTTFMDYQVMQGQLSRFEFDIVGEGQILNVEGEDILSWKILPGDDNDLRLLIVETRRPIKGNYQLRVSSQQTLPAFPVSITPLKISPKGALAFGGYTRISNQGAVKIEIRDTSNLTQVSPERFPGLSGFPSVSGNQVFAYRFSGNNYQYVIHADTILPEVSQSQLTVHTLGASAQTMESLIELDIREAPLREFELNLPVDYVLTRVEGNYIADYFLSQDGDSAQKLRLVFSQPVSGRWTGQIELTRNQILDPSEWTLPQVSSPLVDTSRGHVGVAVEPGLRVSTSTAEGVSEIAAAFFPKKIEGLALAYRLRDLQWNLSIQVEKLEKALQVDTLQLFSIGEGILYGSSLLNYLVSGSPVSSFEVTASDDYANVEFVGKGIRNWKKTENGYEVFLENPVFGTYSLLATFDLKIEKDSTKQYPFEGIHPVTAKNNQGYVLFISHYQVGIDTGDGNSVSDIVQIEPAEIPGEFRLLFDAPLVGSYQYTTYPYELDLEVKQLERGNSLQMLVDRVEVKTEVSASGQAVTLAEYFIKNKSNSHMRFKLPEGLELWGVKVDGENVVTVSDNDSVLVPLKVQPNSNELIRVAIRTAYKPASKKMMSLKLPVLESSALVTRWNVQSTDGKYLKFHPKESTVEPDGLVMRERGFDQFATLIKGSYKPLRIFHLGSSILVISLVFLLVFSKLKKSFKVWRWVPVKELSMAGIVIAALMVLSTVPSAANAHSSPDVKKPISFSIPVSEPDAKHEVTLSVKEDMGFALSCPAVIFLIFGLVLFGGGWKSRGGTKGFLMNSLGWAFILSAALVQYNGLPIFILAVFVAVLIHVLLPVFKMKLSGWSGGGDGSAPVDEEPPAPTDPDSGGKDGGNLAGATAIVTGMLLLGFTGTPRLEAAQPALAQQQLVQGLLSNVAQQQAEVAVPGQNQIQAPLHVKVEKIEQNLSLDGEHLKADTSIVWKAGEGETLTVLGSEAIVQSITFNKKDGIRVLETSGGSNSGLQVIATQKGQYTISLKYKVKVVKGEQRSQAHLQTAPAISHLVTIDFGKEDMEVSSPGLVSSQKVSGTTGQYTYKLVLHPTHQPVLSWQPRRRDARAETAVYFSELRHLFVPAAGVIDGRHMAIIKPAQGVIERLEFNVHESLTIVDVPYNNVRSWRFDPDSRKLMIELTEPQSTPFSLQFLSQSGAGTLPYQKEVGLIHLEGAAGELGFAGVAAPGEVQLDNVEVNGMATLSLEDFLFPQFRNMSFPQSSLRRAYQYSGTGGSVNISVSPVEPDIRAETRMTLSLGEDRTLLALQSNISVTRSGIFKLTFPLPANLEMESLTGAQVSHWTQNQEDDQTIVTIHLKSRTQGQTQIQMNLVGQGMLGNDSLDVPSIQFTEATKQTGLLIISPERGVRLYPETQSGTIQQDASTAGVSRKGALVFKLLQKEWQLAFSIEKVNAWLQANLLQKVTFREGLAKTVAEVILTVENAGVDSLQVVIPSSAESVEIDGKQVVDFVQSADAGDGSSTWDIRFERKVIGQVPVNISYQQPIGASLNQWPLEIIRIQNLNLFKVWVAYKSEGRMRAENISENQGFQPADWSSIPANLRGQKLNPAGFARVLRKVNDSDSLDLTIVRNEVERVLPARILSTRLVSVVTMGGEMLTSVELQLDPGEERQLTVELPGKSVFWLGYINDKSVWPWRDGTKLLLPIEKNPGESNVSVCKFLYFSRFSQSEISDGKFDLSGPGFGLPLEDIQWQVYLPDGVHIKDVEGNLDITSTTPKVQKTASSIAVGKAFNILNVDSYLQNEKQIMEQQNYNAMEFINLGNDALTLGDNFKAQRAFENAINLSQSDPTSNEDARVQFQTIRNMQANIALNARVNNLYFKNGFKSGEVDYNNLTQSQLDDLNQQTSEEDREAMERLADRLVRQQEAAIARPASIYATFPQMGKAWNLQRSHLVEINKPLRAELKIDVDASGFSWGGSIKYVVIFFIATLLVLGIVRLVIKNSVAVQAE